MTWRPPPPWGSAWGGLSPCVDFEFDPADPTSLASLRVNDLVGATADLTAVFGDDGHDDFISTVLTHDDGPVTLAPGRLSAGVGRIALIRWSLHTTPFALDPALLELEAATTFSADGPSEEAQRLISPHIARLGDLTGLVPRLPAHLAVVVVQSVQASVGCIPDEPALRMLSDRLSSLIPELARTYHASLPARTALVERGEVLPVVATRVSSVDMRDVDDKLVHAGLLSGHSQAVTWSVDDGGLACRVEAHDRLLRTVDAGEPLPDAVDALAVRLIDDETGEILVAEGLEWDPQSRRFVATIPLEWLPPGCDLDHLLVDPVSYEVGGSSVVGVERLRGQARRRAAESLAAVRMAHVMAALSGDAAAALSQALRAGRESVAAFTESGDESNAAKMNEWVGFLAACQEQSADPLTQWMVRCGHDVSHGLPYAARPLLAEIEYALRALTAPDQQVAAIAEMAPPSEPLQVVLGTSPFGVATADLTDVGSLQVDPSAPDRVLGATCKVASEARQVWAGAVRDDGARILLANVGAATASHDEPVVATSQVARLALARWRHQLPLVDAPAGATALDVAHAAHLAGDDGLANRLFARWSDYAITLAAGVADRALPEPLVAELHATLVAGAATLGEGAAADELGRMADLLGGSAISDEELSRLWADADARRQRQIAGVESGLFSVDWDHVPARSVSADDGAVMMTVTDGAIDVRVEGHRYRDPEASRHLAVRLVDAHDGNVVLTAALMWSADADAFVAHVELDSTASAQQDDHVSLVPDVFDTRIVSAARVGAANEIAQARRSAVRALAVARHTAARTLMLGRADPDAAARVRRLAQRAERGFRHAGDGVSADRLAAWYAGWTPDGTLEGPASPLLSEMVAEAAPDLFDR